MAQPGEAELKAHFDELDVDGSGSITVGDLQKLAEKVGDGASAEMLQSVISQFDTSGDGKVTYEEFKKAVGY